MNEGLYSQIFLYSDSQNFLHFVVTSGSLLTGFLKTLLPPGLFEQLPTAVPRANSSGEGRAE